MIRLPGLLAPDRAEVLAALALAAQERAAMAEGLARVAAGDPLLGRWARRLEAPLRSGSPLGEVLGAFRLVDAQDARLIDADPEPGAALGRMAAAALRPAPRTWMLLHLPAAMALAIALPVVAAGIVCFALGLSPGVVVDAYGLRLPSLIESLQRPGSAVLTAIVAVAAIAELDWMLARVRGLRHLRHLWCAEVAREHALLRLVQHARTGDDAPAPRSMPQRLGTLARRGLITALLALLAWPLFGVAWLAAGVHRWVLRSPPPPPRPPRRWWVPRAWYPSWPRLRDADRARPRWDRDWRTWIFLTRFRLAREARDAASVQPRLLDRLVTLGVVTVADGRPDLDAAERLCRERLEAATASALLVVRPVLLALAWLGLIGMLAGLVVPFIRLLGVMGS